MRKLSALLVLAAASAARGAVADASWVGGAGSWLDPAKWSPAVAPNNSAATQYRAFVAPAGSAVTLDGSVAVDELSVTGGNVTVAAAGTLGVENLLALANGNPAGEELTVQPGGTLRLGADAQLQGAAGDVRVLGTLDLTGGATLAVGPTTPQVRLRGTGVVVRGGTVATAPGSALTLERDLGPTNGAIVAQFDDVVLNGTVRLGSDTRLTLPAGQAFKGSGTLELLGSPVAAGTGATTVEAGFTVLGNVYSFSSGTYTGGLGEFGQPFVNRGTVVGTGTGLPIRASTIQNLGTFETRGGRLIFAGSFTRADLGTLAHVGTGGQFAVGGTLLNEGQTLQVGGPGGHRWTFDASAGVIRGGTVDVAPGSVFRVEYGDNAALEGDCELRGDFVLGQAVRLSVRQPRLFGDADLVVNPPPLEGPSRVVAAGPGGNLEIAETIRLRTPGGADAFFGAAFDSAATLGFTLNSGVGGSASSGGGPILLNRGELAADGDFDAPPGGSPFRSAMALTAGEVRNAGTVRAAEGGLVDVYGDLVLLDGGVIAVGLNAPLGPGVVRVQRGFDLAGGDVDLTAAGDLLRIDAAGPVALGTSFVALRHYGTVAGTFDLVTPGWLLTYEPGQIVATFVPEPAALAPLAAGAVVALRRVRFSGRGPAKAVR